MKYNNKTQKAREKYLSGEPLTPDEQAVIDKDFQGKDFLYYQSTKEKPLLLDEKYSTNETYKKIENEINKNFILNKKRILVYTSSIAAVMIIAMLSIFIYQANELPTTIVIATSYGERKEVKLPDGSKVTLNSLSSIVYPKEMDGEPRQVELKGEAYFEIAKNAKKTFIVKVKNLDIKVIGTKFNIEAYENENHISTSLFEGSVSVNVHNGVIRKLEPGDKAIYNKSIKSLDITSTDDVNNELHWIKGLLNFNNIPLQEIFNTIEREKNISFKINNPNLAALKITASFNQDEPIEEILDILGESAGFSFKKQGNIYTIIPINGK